MKIKKVSLLVNPEKRKAYFWVKKLLHWLGARKIKVKINEEVKKYPLVGVDFCPAGDLVREADLLITVGGDGTLLYAAQILADREVPVFGLNLGTLGFLTGAKTEEVLAVLEQIFEGHYRLEKRLVATASLWREKQKIKKFTALNDFVITKETLARMIKIEVSISGQKVSSFWGDGLIVSTPTGSTAHSLSAGGPILHPLLEAFVLSPICAHTLTVRPLVVGAEEEITVKVSAKHQDIILTIDGQQGFDLLSGDKVVICQEKWRFHLIIPPQRNFYEVLRKKLK